MSIRKLRSQFHLVLFFLAALCFAVAGIFMDGSFIGRLSYLLLAGLFSTAGIHYFKNRDKNGGTDTSKSEV